METKYDTAFKQLSIMHSDYIGNVTALNIAKNLYVEANRSLYLLPCIDKLGDEGYAAFVEKFNNNPSQYTSNYLGLSEDTKAYLSSYSTSVRPELNDYTKTYLDSLNDTSADAKPELTNLTKEYLSLNTVTEDKKEEENKENDLVIKEEEC